MPSAKVHPTRPTAVALKYPDRSAISASYDAGQLVKEGLPSRDRMWDSLRRCWLVAGAVATERALEILGRDCDFVEVIDMDPPYENGFEHLLADLPPRLRKPAAWALAKVLHPDVGGDHDAMVALNSAIDLRPVRRAS